MKKDIHPKWHPGAEALCSCGHKFTTGASQAQIKVQICSHCHPFFTGEQKFVDALGRVEKFQKKQKAAAKVKATKKEKTKEKEREERVPRTLKEMLMSG